MPPPKPPLTAVSEPDPIYPYLPFLVLISYLAMTVPFPLPQWEKICSWNFLRICAIGLAGANTEGHERS
jgi:hypothetical protein